MRVFVEPKADRILRLHKKLSAVYFVKKSWVARRLKVTRSRRLLLGWLHQSESTALVVHRVQDT